MGGAGILPVHFSFKKNLRFLLGCLPHFYNIAAKLKVMCQQILNRHPGRAVFF
jgi:hypothetical protein